MNTGTGRQMTRELNSDAIPLCLRQLPQWVCWRYEAGRNGKPTKVPYDPRIRRKGSNIDPATWTTFELAVHYYTNSDFYDGVGFVFTTDGPHAGIDLDDCLDDDSRLVGWAQPIVEAFPS